MDKVLIVTSQYLGAASASGICAKNICRELQSAGHDVFVLCYENGELTDNNIYTIFPHYSSFNRTVLFKILRGIRSVFHPNIDETQINNYIEKVLMVCEKEHIGTVVSVSFPLETLAIAKAVKERFPSTQVVFYELDSVGDGISGGTFIKKLSVRAYDRWCDYYYDYADSIIIMESHEKYWKKTFGKKHGDKLLLADIPVLVEKNLPQTDKSSEEPISFLYGGLIEQAYRSPDYLLDIFEEYSKKEDATLDFFSKGDCEEKIAERAKRVKGIRQNGYVPEAVLNETIARADVLVSIGNRFSRSVPSKLITYLSYGKPVVHFASSKNDVCVEYLEKYPLGLVINEWDPIGDNVSKLHSFVGETRGKTVSFEEVSGVLIRNTPEYSVGLIEKL